MPRFTAPKTFHMLSALALLLARPLHSETSATANANTTPVPPAPTWDISGALRASAGYRQNVTVSSYQSLDRPFSRGEVEAFMMRAVGTEGKFISFISGDVLRYAHAPEGVSGEQQWVGQLEGRWQPAPFLRATAKGVSFIQDVFIDPSETEGAPLPATWVRLLGGYVMVAPRFTIRSGLSLEPSLQLKRIDYRRGYGGDYNVSRPGLRMEWQRGERLVISAAWYEHRRHYSSLSATSGGGRILKDRRLGIFQREGELRATTAFDAAGHWNIAAFTGLLRNRDRAFGFLDYDEKRAGLDVSWERKGWHVTLRGEVRHQEYRRQSVGFGTEPSPRIAEAYDATARLERELAPKWSVFAEERWERNRSNIIDDAAYRFSYRTNMAQLGLQRSF